MGVHTSPPSSPPTAPAPSAPMICQESCLDWTTVTANGGSISYQGNFYLYDQPGDFGPNPADVQGRARTDCVNQYHDCWYMGPLFSPSPTTNNRFYFSNNDGFCDDGYAPVQGGAALTANPTTGIFGNGRGFRAFSLRDNLYPITIQFAGTPASGAPTSMSFQVSDEINNYVHLPAVCNYGHDCADCGPRPASGAPWTNGRRLREEWVEYPHMGFRTKRGSPYDLDFVRELAIGKHRGHFVNMSLPLKLAYAVDAYDVKNDIMPRINEQKQLELLLKHVPQKEAHKLMKRSRKRRE